VATIVRNPNNICILNEIGNERCCLGRENECWIWDRRMGHMNFDNLVKISRKEALREIPEISKLASTMSSIVYMENIQEQNLDQRNTLQQRHWKLCTLIYVDQ
jgi:hypothetical protein